MVKADYHKISCRDPFFDKRNLPLQPSVLQSYNMNWIGFIQDLIHGIAKVFVYRPLMRCRMWHIQMTILEPAGGSCDCRATIRTMKHTYGCDGVSRECDCIRSALRIKLESGIF